MNRNEFLIVTSLSGLVAVLLLLQIVFVKMANSDQARAMQAQQQINQGQACLRNLQQIAQAIGALSQQSGDPALKDLMTRQGIAFAPPGQGAENSSTPAPSTTPTPAPTH